MLRLKKKMYAYYKEIKLSLFIDNMISYTENPSDQPKNFCMESLQDAWLIWKLSLPSYTPATDN